MTNTVLITGANKGIGFEVAHHLGLQGWQILVGARNRERGMAVVEKLQAEGTEAELVMIDLGAASAVKRIITKH